MSTSVSRRAKKSQPPKRAISKEPRPTRVPTASIAVQPLPSVPMNEDVASVERKRPRSVSEKPQPELPKKRPLPPGLAAIFEENKRLFDELARLIKKPAIATGTTPMGCPLYNTPVVTAPVTATQPIMSATTHEDKDEPTPSSNSDVDDHEPVRKHKKAKSKSPGLVQRAAQAAADACPFKLPHPEMAYITSVPAGTPLDQVAAIASSSGSVPLISSRGKSINRPKSEQKRLRSCSVCHNPLLFGLHDNCKAVKEERKQKKPIVQEP